MTARQAPRQVPVTMLSGFLGAGKTTLLRYLLEQNEERIGCIVNDVASVNIDAKLIRNDRSKDKDTPNTTSDLADTIELANGCACCSIQDELLSSFEQLLALADQRGFTYDRFVLENSGVAEPQNLRDKFQEAAGEGHPVMSRIALDNLVTVVDSGTFLKAGCCVARLCTTCMTHTCKVMHMHRHRHRQATSQATAKQCMECEKPSSGMSVWGHTHARHVACARHSTCL